MVEHGIVLLGGRGEIGRHSLFDLRGALLQQGVFPILRPESFGGEVGSQPTDWLARPFLLHDLRIAVACGVVGRGVVAQTESQRLDQRRAAAVARFLYRLTHDLIDRDHVVAVDLNSLDAGANRLLRESFRGAFAFPRRRNRPTIVVDHDDDRRFPYARHVQRLVKGAIAGPAVPDETDRDPIFQ